MAINQVNANNYAYQVISNMANYKIKLTTYDASFASISNNSDYAYIQTISASSEAKYIGIEYQRTISTSVI